MKLYKGQSICYGLKRRHRKSFTIIFKTTKHAYYSTFDNLDFYNNSPYTRYLCTTVWCNSIGIHQCLKTFQNAYISHIIHVILNDSALTLLYGWVHMIFTLSHFSCAALFCSWFGPKKRTRLMLVPLRLSVGDIKEDVTKRT